MKYQRYKVLKPYIKDIVYDDDDGKYVTLHIFQNDKFQDTSEFKIATELFNDPSFNLAHFMMEHLYSCLTNSSKE